MSKAQARAYLDRWVPVRRLEAAELRRASYETRFQQMLACHRLARGLGVARRIEDAQDDAVRRRWILLKGRGRGAR